MKRKHLLKSLLVAVGLLVGGNAWAEDTYETVYSKSLSKWTSTDVSATEWVATNVTPTISTDTGKGLCLSGAPIGGYSVKKSFTISSNAKVKYEGVWTVNRVTGRNNNYCYIQFGDKIRLSVPNPGIFYLDTDGTSSSTTPTGVSTSSKSAESYNFSIIINTATGVVESFIFNSKDLTSSVGTLTGNFDSFTIGFQRGGSGSSENNLTTLTVSEAKQTVTTANYTVHYLCGEVKVKDDVIRQGIVGDPISITEADKAAVIKDGSKYVYASDDSEGKTLAAEGTVVTVTFTESAKYAYKLNAVDPDGNFLKELGAGEQFAGEDATVYFNKAIFVNNKWYITEFAGNWVFHEAKEENIKFTEDASISYFFEVEDINKSKNWAATGAYPDRYSNGKVGRLSSDAYAYTDALEGGIYSVTLWGRNQAGSSEAAIGLFVRDAEGNETKCGSQYENWVAGAQGTKTVMVNIPDGYSLELKNESAEWNSNLEMDYLILRKSTINTMSIVGFTPESGLTDADKWNPANGIAMTQDENNPAIWTAVVKDYVITGTTDTELIYYYKAVANGVYGEYELPASGNQDYNFNWSDGTKGEGMYTLTFTANTLANTVELAIEKQKTATVYFINTGGWAADNIKAYVWNSTSNNGWPGEKMEATGEQIDNKDVYTWSTYALDLPTMIIISNNGSDTDRTGDQPFVNGATYKADGTSTVAKTISAAGYATFYCESALDFTGTGLTVYVASVSGKEVNFTKVTTSVPANTGVLLMGAAGEYNIPTTTTADATITSALVGVLKDTKVAGGIFVLMNGAQGVGFYKTTNAFTVGANTAYLPAQVASAREFIGFGDDTTTSINAISNEKMNGEVYNLNGQRVVAPQKGLYIVNGKKVVLK